MTENQINSNLLKQNHKPNQTNQQIKPQHITLCNCKVQGSSNVIGAHPFLLVPIFALLSAVFDFTLRQMSWRHLVQHMEFLVLIGPNSLGLIRMPISKLVT